MDLFVKEPQKIAVEIKVNYWGEAEIGAFAERGEKRSLPKGAIKDIEKLRKAGPHVQKVFMMSIVFESRKALRDYKRVFDRDQKVLKGFNFKWYDCSAYPNGGHNLLLVISDIKL
jgi:hypothetical protein